MTPKEMDEMVQNIKYIDISTWMNVPVHQSFWMFKFQMKLFPTASKQHNTLTKYQEARMWTL